MARIENILRSVAFLRVVGSFDFVRLPPLSAHDDSSIVMTRWIHHDSSIVMTRSTHQDSSIVMTGST
jgi:hypothetical protein